MICAIDAHEITWGEFKEAIEGFSSEGLQLISAVLEARAVSLPESPYLMRRSREFCRARAASLRNLS